jgi:DJ-1/PfpI family
MGVPVIRMQYRHHAAIKADFTISNHQCRNWVLNECVGHPLASVGIQWWAVTLEVPEMLVGRKIAILVTDGFEQVELLKPRQALDQAGAFTQVVSPSGNKVKGWNFKEWGEEVDVDVPLEKANAGDFDALHLPGGVMNPDHLRMNAKAV